MKQSTKHKIEGKVLEMKGVVKQNAGEMVNDHALRAKGATERVVGKLEQALGAAEARLDK